MNTMPERTPTLRELVQCVDMLTTLAQTVNAALKEMPSDAEIEYCDTIRNFASAALFGETLALHGYPHLQPIAEKALEATVRMVRRTYPEGWDYTSYYYRISEPILDAWDDYDAKREAANDVTRLNP